MSKFGGDATIRTVTSVADAHADMTTALSDAPCNSFWPDATLRCFANQQTIETALQAQLDEKHAPTKAAGVPWS